jgi:hypothetical protein
MNFKNRVLLLVFLCVCWIPRIACQTAATGALTGTVSDPSGAVIPNATVTATSVDTGQVRTTITGADAFNHPQFSFTPNNDSALANQDASSATFGQITTSSVNPRLIQLALKYWFQCEVRGMCHLC